MIRVTSRLMVALLLAPSAVHALTIEQVADLQKVREVAISPDGKTIAFTVSEPRAASEDNGSARTPLWVLREGDQSPRRYTAATESVRSLAFTPDGRDVAFLASRGKNAKPQVHALPLGGGEAVPLTDAPEGVIGFALSPKGDRIAYLTLAPEDADRKKAAKQGYDAEVVGEYHRHHLLQVVPLDDPKAKPVTVTPADRTAVEMDWSPDGKHLVVMTAPSPGSDDSMMRRRLEIYPAAGGAPKGLAEKMGKMIRPRWSPDGRTIAWLGAQVPNDGTEGTVWTIPAAGGTPKPLNTGAEETVYDVAWVGKRDLLVSAVTGTRSHLSRRTLDGDKEVLSDESWPVFLGFSVDKAGRRIAMAASTPKHPPEVYAGPLARPERRTHRNPVLDEVALGEQTAIEWTASDGKTIGGVLVKPVGVTGRAPLIVKVHGGPEWQELNWWNTDYLGPVQVLANQGYAVLLPNYRGSAGRGAAFAMADHKDLGGQELQDILDGVAYLHEQGIADQERAAMIGGSYGGFMSALAATKASEHFDAAINFAGIASWLSFTGTSDIPYEMSEVHWNLWCYDEPEACRKGSPLTYLDRAKTPLMIVHGKEDKRVPIGQAWELYRAFEVRDLPVQLVLYPREGHGLAERAHQIDLMRRTMAWFDQHVKKTPQASR